METKPRARAGENEKRFKRLFVEKANGTPTLLGKRSYAREGAATSVDESFKHDGREVLIEIDSCTVAKPVVAQYVLLNLLREDAEAAFFLVIHTNPDYKPHRTLGYLSFVNQELFQGRGIPFGAIHLSELESWNGNVEELLKLAE